MVFRKVYVLNNGSNEKKQLIPEAEVIETEKELILVDLKILKIIQSHLHSMGDDFDLPYLYMRSRIQE